MTGKPAARTAVALLTVLFVAEASPPGIAAQDIPDTSVEAIRAYADGAEAYLAEDYDLALTHFRRAHQLDATFFTPVFMQYVVSRNMGDTALRDSLEVVLQQNRNRMSGYYQGMFDALVLRLQNQFAASSEVLRGVVERYPGTKAAYNYANYVWQRDPGAALRALEQLDPDREPIRGWYSYWSIRHQALHTLGELEAALDNARRAQRHHPDRLGPVTWEAYMHAALGNVDQMEAALARAMEFPDALPGVGYRDAGQELVAHGYEPEGRALLERALAWFDDEDRRTGSAPASQRAYTLFLLDRHVEARDAYRALADAAPTNPGYQAFFGVTSALAGDRTTAEGILERVRADEIGANWITRAGYEVLLHAALGDATSAKQALATYGLRALWLHRDPVLRSVLGPDPEFRRFLGVGR